jgi:hypothetical protein
MVFYLTVGSIVDLVLTRRCSSSAKQTVCVTISVPQNPYDSTPNYNDPNKLQQISTFCKIIRSPTYQSVGFYLDDTGYLKAYSCMRPTAKHVDQCLTLEALLPYFEAKLPILELYGLAITLVASVFQLSRTPWLDTKWSKKSIVFSRANNNPPLTVDVKYPYLSKDFHGE